MRRAVLLPLGMLVFAACAELPTAAPAPQEARFSGSAVYGHTLVRGTFTLVPGSIPPGVNQHPQGRGTCRNEAGVPNPFPGTANPGYTIYYNEQGQRTGNSFCQGSAGSAQPVDCAVDGIPAFYGVENGQPGVGAPEYLAFDIIHESANPERFVRYDASPNPGTLGRGVVQFTFTCAGGIAGGGRFVLDQFQAPANLFSFAAGSPHGAADDRHLSSAGIVLSTDRGAGHLTSMYWSLDW